MTPGTKIWSGGLAVFVIGIAAGAFVMHRTDGNIIPKQPNIRIVLPDKNYTDTKDSVSVSGRWEGTGVPYKNNAVMISCDHGTSICTYYKIEQVGKNQIGDLDIPNTIPITKWDAYEISANDADQDPGYWCTKTTINIDRKNQTAELVLEPINPSSLSCAKADNKTYKWSLAGSFFWDDLRARSAAALAK